MTVTGDALNKLKNQLVSVASDQKGKVSVARMVGSVPGDLDVAARKVGNKMMADNVAIYQTTSTGLQSIALNKIPSAKILASGIVSCRTDWAGKIDLILISSVTGGEYRFGRLNGIMNDNGQITTVKILMNGADLGPFSAGFEIEDDAQVHDGDYVGVILNRQETMIEKLVVLTKFTNIPNSAWASVSSVTIGGRSYTVPSDVLCYNKASGKWVTMDEARAFATSSTVYTDKSGYVRVVEVQ